MKRIIILCLILSFQVVANDSQYLIKEMESLRDSLPLEDPSRIDLTLRLADLYFDVSIKEGADNNEALLKKNRMKAFSLYENSLYGKEGLKKAEGLNRIKILFQMGRLLSRLDEKEKAQSYYSKVYYDKKSPKKLKEQSSLALAEWFEEDAQYKKANDFYRISIGLCEAVQTCNYAHYRRAWLLYKDTKLDEAIAELKLSLWDPEKNIRENSLQDLLMFMSNTDTDGFKELAYIKELSVKINRPLLPNKLTEAFYAAGNRRAGSNLLATINEKKSNLFYEVRLLEEFYGFRNWEKSEFYLDTIATKKVSDLPTKKEQRDEVRKILRRFIVQVDAETQVVADLNSFLKKSIDIYLSFYPNDKLRKKMQQGWLKAEDDKKSKVDRLAIWIDEDIKFGIEPKEIRKLRQTRLALAQELKLNDIMIVESLALRDILRDSDESREFTYVAARGFYEKKDFQKALPLFKELADSVTLRETADKWAILSQNLALDIYNQQKNYSKIMEQVNIWKSVPQIANNVKLSKEMSSMNVIFTQAEFEKTTRLGESEEALAKFFNFCKQQVYAEKSCKNAKVLAVKLKDQKRLVSLLEMEKDEKALIDEYEIMGRFSDSALLREKLVLNSKSPLDEYFRVALLYELDQKFKQRNRVLTSLVNKIKKTKTLPTKYEGALFTTLDEAGLIGPRSLSIPWSLSRKIALANRIETEKSNKASRKVLLSKKITTGPHWAIATLDKLQAKFSKISRIGFYGRGSKWKFKKRTKAIDKFSTEAKSYLEGADSQTRVYILQMIKTNYEILAVELRSTPLPEGLDDATLTQVMTQLDTMAAPFEKVAADYTRLQKAELDNLKDEKLKVVANLENVDARFSSFIELPTYSSINVASFDYDDFSKSKNQLLIKPDSLDALKNMEVFFTKNKSKRLATYFKQRVSSLEPVNKEI